MPDSIVLVIVVAALISTNALDHALTTVTPDDLYTPANRRIYAAMARLHARGGPWMTNSNVPDTDTRWVTPFVSVATQVAGVTGAFIDCVTVEQVSQAVSPYDLSLFSAEYIADS